MNQAQGAIEAARAAGAERYAPEEYGAAVAALERSRSMETQRDFRQALNFALDARERAHDAARAGAERMAQVRSEAETSLQTATATLQTAEARAKNAPTPRGAERGPATLRDAIARAQKDLQEARTAILRQEYTQARDAAKAIDQRLREALEAADQPAPTRDRRRTAKQPADAS